MYLYLQYAAVAAIKATVCSTEPSAADKAQGRSHVAAQKGLEACINADARSLLAGSQVDVVSMARFGPKIGVQKEKR